jgi:hypothetical protein
MMGIRMANSEVGVVRLISEVTGFVLVLSLGASTPIFIDERI